MTIDAPEPKATRAKPRDRLLWLIARGHIPVDALEIGDELLKLAEARGKETITSSRMGGEGGAGPVNLMHSRITAKRKWEQLMGIVGPKAEAVITTIIVDGKAPADAAAELNINPRAIVPMLELALHVIGQC